MKFFNITKIIYRTVIIFNEEEIQNALKDNCLYCVDKTSANELRAKTGKHVPSPLSSPSTYFKWLLLKLYDVKNRPSFYIFKNF